MKGGLASRGQSVSRHAEMDAMRYLRNHTVRKARLVIVRLLADGGFGNSRPCCNCIKRIIYHYPSVAHVTFYAENGIWQTETPQACAVSSVLSSADRMLSRSV